MNLSALLDREPPLPWSEGSKLPWDDPLFSSRMLREHLSQHHDQASRRLHLIERHVDWIHNTVLDGRPGHVLDLGCGPGLYTTRLASLGHTCVGIDFSPASIAYARTEARRKSLPCDYRLQDLRSGNFGSGFQAVLLVFGELNTFSPSEAHSLLSAACDALTPSGVLALEVHTEAHVLKLGKQPPTWFSAHRGLFSDQPHVCLRESEWHAASRAAVERYFIIDAGTAAVETYMSTTQAYSVSEYAMLLRDAGFDQPEQHRSLAGTALAGDSELFVLLARKKAA